MSLFSKVAMRCNVCACVMMTDFQQWGGRFCGNECSEEYNTRKAYAIMGVDSSEKREPYIKKENRKDLVT